MFLRVVCLQNHSHCFFSSNPIASINCYSLRGCNVAVKYTICVSICTKFLNANMQLRNPSNESNTMWHSSIMIRSNRPIARWWLM
jgi:hypothetical protein